MIAKTRDNCRLSDEILLQCPNLVNQLVDRPLKDLQSIENLLIFPRNLSESDDLAEDNYIFERVKQDIRTGNIVGFIGYGKEKLTIRSRFSEGEDDYFLHYLLKNLSQVNLLNLDASLSFEEELYHLLIYLFPHYLREALKVGLYKEYRQFHFNDNHLKGSIQIDRHIRENTPFIGNISYNTRLLTYDNPVLQLVRHTIETIKKSLEGKQLLTANQEIKETVQHIVESTPSYAWSQGLKLIQVNRKAPVRHAYYQAYRRLQELCLMILSFRQHDFGDGRHQVYGLIVDISWLWEEYLQTLLKAHFIHSENRKRKNGISIFSSHQRYLFPDFYSEDGSLVLDAKYKKLEQRDREISREDLYQLITYSYILKSRLAGLLYPSSQHPCRLSIIGCLEGYSGELFKLSLQIPQNSQSFEAFVAEMADFEAVFLEKIYDLCQQVGMS